MFSMRSVTNCSLVVWGLLLAVGPVSGDVWPQWLGPHRDATWRESGILVEFPKEGPPLRWTAPLGGGYSGPAVADGRVIVMDWIAGQVGSTGPESLHKGDVPSNTNFVRNRLPGMERVVCLDESNGKPLWTYEYQCAYTTATTYAIGPRATPTIDGERVYTLGAEGDLLCLNVRDGSVVWSVDFKERYDLNVPVWGCAAHPLVDNEQLICVVGGEETVCVSLDKRTGKERWRALSAAEPGYCPPVIYEIAAMRQLIIWHSDSVNGLDPETGSVYWSVPFSSDFAMSIGAPRLEGHSLFVMCFSQKSALIDIAEDGKSAQIRWKGGTKTGIGGVLNTPFVEQGHVYACGHEGRYTCANLARALGCGSPFSPRRASGPLRGEMCSRSNMKTGSS